MRKVERSEQADSDLLDILTYVHDQNPAAAIKLAARFEKLFTLLSDHPWAGVDKQEYGAGLRGFVTGNYAILYKVDSAENVLVVRVLHSARDIDALMATD